MGDDRLSGAVEREKGGYDPTCKDCHGTGKVWATSPGVYGYVQCRCYRAEPPKDPQATVRRQEAAEEVVARAKGAIHVGSLHGLYFLQLENAIEQWEALQEGGKRENE